MKVDNLMFNSGVLIVNKPIGITSHDVVAKCRKLLNTKKIGHAGTLDPLATGVLLLGVGRATKILGLLQAYDKEYLAKITLGIATATDDITGQIIQKANVKDIASISEKDIYQSCKKFFGNILQVPSQVSAVKIRGRKAYDLVRQGELVKLNPRAVRISKLEIHDITSFSDKIIISVLVECSSGTYIRAIARDLGNMLKIGGCISELTRSRVGKYDLSQATTLAALAACPRLSLSLDDFILQNYPVVHLTVAQHKKIANGGTIPALSSSQLYALVNQQKQVIAIAKNEGLVAKPVVIIRPANLNSIPPK